MDGRGGLMHRSSMRKTRCMYGRGLVTSALLATATWGCHNDSGGSEVASAGSGIGSGGTDAADTGNDPNGTSGGDDTGGNNPEAQCEGITPGPSPVRRMTRVEYDNTVRDLLGDKTRPGLNFPAEEESLGFNNNADTLVVAPILAEQYQDAAEKLAEAAVLNHLPALLGGCNPASLGEAVCAEKFVTNFGPLVYRRPLAAEESTALLAVFNAGLDQFDFETGIRLVLTTMLQSPHFLYRVEFGAPIEGETEVRKVAPYELASRLSYFLWGSMPDATLIKAAASGKLETRADVAAQARRMLGDPRAREAVREFHDQWLKLNHIEEVQKDPDMYPDFDPAVLALLRTEAETFIDHVIWDGEGDLNTMLQAPYTFMNADLAKHYGVVGPMTDAFEKVELGPSKASGFLTQGGLMAVLAKANQTSPIHRGKFIRESILCQFIPPPPDNVDITPPEVDPSLPTRERFLQHSADPFCAGCHSLMDPVGFGFEHFDGIGKWRDTEAGKPINATGEIISAKVMGTFDGVPGLATMLVESPEVEACMTRQWFRFAYGRGEKNEDNCILDELGAEFAASGRSIPDLLVTLTQTDAFMYRTHTGEGESK